MKNKSKIKAEYIRRTIIETNKALIILLVGIENGIIDLNSQYQQLAKVEKDLWSELRATENVTII